jgi:hypothetical protein
VLTSSSDTVDVEVKTGRFSEAAYGVAVPVRESIGGTVVGIDERVGEEVVLTSSASLDRLRHPIRGNRNVITHKAVIFLGNIFSSILNSQRLITRNLFYALIRCHCFHIVWTENIPGCSP